MTDEKDKDKDKDDTKKEAPRKKIMRKIQRITGIYLISIPILAAIFINHKSAIENILSTYPFESLVALLTPIGLWLISKSKEEKNKSKERFTDIDAEISKKYNSRALIRNHLEELEEIRLTAIAGLQKNEITPVDKFNSNDLERAHETSFIRHFEEISKNLEQKAEGADIKASMLLDKGTTYTKFGIGVFIASIISWQILISIYGFKTQHIYGIASTSLLFIFIEFLSAWFLKQHRQFADTSTYITKVKSIFDRYMLIYLIATDKENKSNNEIQFNQLVEILGRDMSWPESYLNKNPDISFAKETIESLSKIIESINASKERSNKNQN